VTTIFKSLGLAVEDLAAAKLVHDARVVHYGPFLMNTEGQIMQAIEDFRAGEF
jgi:redox-sensitive bicupin YhaK (pirin superfamily)